MSKQRTHFLGPGTCLLLREPVPKRRESEVNALSPLFCPKVTVGAGFAETSRVWFDAKLGDIQSCSQVRSKRPVSEQNPRRVCGIPVQSRTEAGGPRRGATDPGVKGGTVLEGPRGGRVPRQARRRPPGPSRAAEDGAAVKNQTESRCPCGHRAPSTRGPDLP